MLPTSSLSHRAPSIERWVVERVAFYLDCRVRDVDPSVPLAETGIGSASAIGLCGDVEDRWQIDADPTARVRLPHHLRHRSVHRGSAGARGAGRVTEIGIGDTDGHHH